MNTASPSAPAPSASGARQGVQTTAGAAKEEKASKEEKAPTEIQAGKASMAPGDDEAIARAKAKALEATGNPNDFQHAFRSNFK